MARLNNRMASTPSRDTQSAVLDTTPNHGARSTSRQDHNRPLPSQNSDKENEPVAATTVARNKGKARMPLSGNLPTPTSEPTSEAHSAKRRRLDASHSRLGDADEDVEDDLRKYYNPDQDPEERQELKRKSRALEREFNQNRDVYLKGDHQGLENTINRANTIFENVKQTADATLDSRLMVNVTDLLSKKSAQMVLGDTSTGIDLDDFVSKCISFMRRDPVQDDPSAPPTTTQRRRRRQTQRDDNEDDDDDDDDNAFLDWAALGSTACLPYNVRPPVPAFLLGPLSVQKKARAQTQRRARQARDTGGNEVRPEALTRDDLGQTENNTLTVLCSKIRQLLQRHCARAERAANQPGADPADIMREYRVSETGGPYLFDFVINPHSFGQTVENIFYVSFLIKEGNVGVFMDSDGLPTLIPAEPGTDAEKRSRGSKKHQAVFSLDYDTWQKLIRAFEITVPLIEHRAEQSTQVSGRGWYA